jgi:preprotein translocase subunit YajC
MSVRHSAFLDPPLSVAALDLMMIAPSRGGGQIGAKFGNSSAPLSAYFPIRIFAPVFAFFCHCLLLAEAQAAAPAQGQAPAGDPYAPLRLLGWLLITAILFYFIMLRPQKQKDQALRNKIGSLKESDRVVTIGGIHGVVTNVQRDAERVTIRVDEATGTKLRVSMSAIASVLTGDEEEGAATGLGSLKSGGTKS